MKLFVVILAVATAVSAASHSEVLKSEFEVFKVNLKIIFF